MSPGSSRSRPVVPGYELGAELGRGATAVVYRAVRLEGTGVSAGTSVAIKVFGQRLADAERFEREARLQEALGAAGGFVALLGRGVLSEGQSYLVLALAEGGSLRERLGHGPLGVESVVELMTALARAVARAHATGIVHRDLKPENVLFAGGRPLVSDLGLGKHFDREAKGASQSSDLSRSYQLRGSAGYMAPEQASDSKHVGPPADVFALGAIAYECLVGAPAFEGVTLLEVVVAAARGLDAPVAARRPDAPAWLASVIERALDPDPARRFPSAAELLAALESRSVQRLKPRAGASGGRATSGAALAGVAVAAVSIATVALAILAARSLVGSTSPTVAPVSPAASPRATPDRSLAPSGNDAPEWFRALAERERPRLPLPHGLRFGTVPRTYVAPIDGSELVFVPAATFVMGANDAQLVDGPPHEVTLAAFFIGRFEVTNLQFEGFARKRNYKTTAEQSDSVAKENETVRIVGDELLNRGTRLNPLGKGKPRADEPVSQVSWIDAQAYVEWAGFQLPSEAQWECAASWDPKEKHARVYSWGDWIPSKDSPLVGNVSDETRHRLEGGTWTGFDGYDDGFEGPSPVGTFPLGASPCGALDMTGNVSEWCADGYDFPLESYEPGPASNPLARSSGRDYRMVRGANYRARPDTTNQYRGYKPSLPTDHDPAVGFRVLLAP